jgi:nicotinamidase-related amidase
VIDVQNGVVGGAYERDTVVANVATVVEKARAAEVPVVWVQHSSDNLAVGLLVVVGAQTDECVRSTLHRALVRDYDAKLVSDAHTTEDLSPWGAPPTGARHRAHESLLGQP